MRVVVKNIVFKGKCTTFQEKSANSSCPKLNNKMVTWQICALGGFTPFTVPDPQEDEKSNTVGHYKCVKYSLKECPTFVIFNYCRPNLWTYRKISAVPGSFMVDFENAVMTTLSASQCALSKYTSMKEHPSVGRSIRNITGKKQFITEYT